MHIARAAGLLAFMVLPSLCLSGAMGPAPWTQLELTSPTNLGVFHVKATTTINEGHIRLDQLSIDLDGKPLRWPKKVDRELRVMHPQLNKLQVVSTRTYTCLEECPDISAWPVWLQFSPEGIEEITMLTCAKGETRERVLYTRKVAGE